MNRQELEEVFHIPKEIEDIEKRIARLEKKTEMVSDVVQNGYKRHAVIFGVDVIRQYNINKNHEKLDKFKKKLSQKKEEIENYIETIPFSEIRQIFRYRYLDGMNWIQVAHEMNGKYKRREYNEDSVRMKHDRYLKKNKEIS